VKSTLTAEVSRGLHLPAVDTIQSIQRDSFSGTFALDTIRSHKAGILSPWKKGCVLGEPATVAAVLNPGNSQSSVTISLVVAIFCGSREEIDFGSGEGKGDSVDGKKRL
jgi:hypothetical protein